MGHYLIVQEVLEGSVLDILTQLERARLKEANMEMSRDWMVRYTDGSMTGSGSGYGVFRSSPRLCMAESFGSYCAVFQAEVLPVPANACREGCLTGQSWYSQTHRALLLRSRDTRWSAQAQYYLDAVPCSPNNLIYTNICSSCKIATLDVQHLCYTYIHANVGVLHP